MMWWLKENSFAVIVIITMIWLATVWLLTIDQRCAGIVEAAPCLDQTNDVRGDGPRGSPLCDSNSSELADIPFVRAPLPDGCPPALRGGVVVGRGAAHREAVGPPPPFHRAAGPTLSVRLETS